ncbi:MAG: DUF2339 domain-containing protein [Acidobacteriota bacterium]
MPMGSHDDADFPLQQPANPAVADRLARLEAEVAALRADLAAIHSTPPPFRVPPPPAPHPPVPTPRPTPRPHIPALSFSTKAAPNQSLESQLGERLFSKVAIVLLLVGAAWFLKWAFENRWIGPRGRILAGLVAGIAVVLWSERFRRQNMFAFSYALKAVGSGVLYLSLWASFQLYHLLPATVALIAMIAVTIWNAIMAWSQDALVLAAYALLGAYLTPLLLSTGGDHEVFLFTYLLTIALSLLVLLRLKPWSILLLGAFPATAIFFIGWYSEFFDPTKATLTSVFAVLLWAAFAAVPLLATTAEGLIVSILTSLAAAIFGALTLYSILVDSGNRDWDPWAAVGFAAIYLGFTRIRPGVIAAVHLSLAIVFLTIAIPLKATGHGIALGWLVEAVALLAIISRSTIEQRARNVLAWLAWAALLLGAGAAMVDPYILGGSPQPFFNRDFATSLAAAVALIVAMILARRIEAGPQSLLSSPVIAAGALVLLNLVLLSAMHREIFLAFVASDSANTELADFAFSGWMMLQGTAMLVFGFLLRRAPLRWFGLVLLAATVFKAVLYDMRSLGTGYRVASYLCLGALFMAISYAYQKDWLGLREPPHTELESTGGDA